MSKDIDSLFSDDIDNLFDSEESFAETLQKTNILIIGKKNLYRRFNRVLDDDQYNLIHVNNVDEAIVELLQELFGVVILDNDDENIDVATVSRVVKINHPLARVVVTSKRRGSKLIAYIVNHGSVDAFITLPIKPDYIANLISEQQARHEISKMLTNFVSQPPKLSKASYLLLDPSLSFGDENEPVKFVGMMVAYKSVPRFSKFFEDILAKDEILFSGYLSGIAMLGKELMTSKEPLKEINFGGVSVIFRFEEDLHISIFLRNLTRYNYDAAEEKITEVIGEMLAKHSDEIQDMDLISKTAFADIIRITNKFVEDDDSLVESAEKKNEEQDAVSILIYGSQIEDGMRLKKNIDTNMLNKALIAEKGDKIFSYVSEYNCGVVLLDSKIPNYDDPLVFAEYCKEISPSIQVIYRIRDRRASQPMIEALNSNLIDFIIPYKSPLKDVYPWLHKAVERVIEIKQQSTSGEGIDSSLDQATVARTMIRKNVESYIPDVSPELHGIFIFRDMHPVFQIFWEHYSTKIEFDEDMMAGLMASLDSIGGEMELGGIGSLELGGAKIPILGNDEIKIAFFVKNIDPNTSVVIEKEFINGSQKILEIISDTKRPLDDFETQARFDTVSNQIFSHFNELFVE